MVHPEGKFSICGIPFIHSFIHPVNLFMFGSGDKEMNIMACLSTEGE